MKEEKQEQTTLGVKILNNIYSALITDHWLLLSGDKQITVSLGQSKSIYSEQYVLGWGNWQLTSFPCNRVKHLWAIITLAIQINSCYIHRPYNLSQAYYTPIQKTLQQ